MVDNRFEVVLGVNAYRQKLLNALHFFIGCPVTKERLDSIGGKIAEIVTEAKKVGYSDLQLGLPVTIKCSAGKYIFYSNGTYSKSNGGVSYG